MTSRSLTTGGLFAGYLRGGERRRFTATYWTWSTMLSLAFDSYLVWADLFFYGTFFL